MEIIGYQVLHINVENFKNITEKDLLTFLTVEFKERLDVRITSQTLAIFHHQLKRIKEAALAYSFETYIQNLVQMFEGKSYLEPHSGLGRCDLLINIANREYVIEFKIFRDIFKFEKGKNQLAYYAKTLGLTEAIYLVFVLNTVNLPDIREQEETVAEILIRTYIVQYDEEKDF